MQILTLTAIYYLLELECTMAEHNVEHIYLQEPIFPDHYMSHNILLHFHIECFRKFHLDLHNNGIIKWLIRLWGYINNYNIAYI